MQFCDLCKHREVADFPTCTNCGVRANEIFDDDDRKSVLERFCEYVFQTQHKNAVCLAHNAKGFDAQFILRWCHKNHKCPDLISKGLSLLQMEAESIKFLCSLSFLPMALSALPKAFTLPSEKGIFLLSRFDLYRLTFNASKNNSGHFPYLFIKRDNYDYRGPLPPKADFGPDNMKAGALREFNRWYDEERAKNEVWDFREQLAKYCKADVRVLRQATTKFRDLILGLEKIDPFKECITLASLCMRIFRKNYMKVPFIASIFFSRFSLSRSIFLMMINQIADRQRGGGARARLPPQDEPLAGGHKVAQVALAQGRFEHSARPQRRGGEGGEVLCGRTEPR